MSGNAQGIADMRMAKLEGLRNAGRDPYRERFVRGGSVKYYINNFKEGLSVSVSGRIMGQRGHGKTVFFDLYDFTGRIQIYVREDTIGKQEFAIFKYADIGDIAGVKGSLFKTKTGEITVLAEDVSVLSKSMRPLPEKWHGLKDMELRYRQRHMDLIVNRDVRDVFIKRFNIISCIRRALDSKGYIEVETPMMHSLPGGAAARPFITHHTALDIDLYMRIAPELYLKRLLVGGFEKIYEINRNFRNEGISRVHNPEFTMLEAYAAYTDYIYMMDLTENIICTAAKDVCGGYIIKGFGGEETDLTPPWKRKTIYEAIEEYAGVNMKGISESEYAGIAESLKVDITGKTTPLEIMDEIFKVCVEKKLTRPVFITDYPIGMCPLSKAKADDPSSAERFELFINGMEIANAYSELNDPVEQRRRFNEQLKDASGETRRVDEDFLNALECAMPPAGGLGIGIDRLVMVLTGTGNIRDVILFPQLKPVSG